MPEPVDHPAPGLPDPADPLGYLEALIKRKRLILLLTLSAFILSIGLALVLPKTYASTVRIIPPQQDQGIMGMMLGQMGGGGLAGLAGSMIGKGTQADQYASILESERVMGAIIDRFKLMERYQQKYRMDMYKKMSGFVEVRAGKKDGIISITVEDEDPKQAAAIANGYVEEFSKLVSDMSVTDATQDRRFLEERLARSRADLARAEEAMKSFQIRNKAVNVVEQAKASLEGVALLKAQIAVQKSQLSALRSQFTESTQEVRTLKASIQNLTAQLASLEGTGTGAIPSVGSVPALGQEQLRLLREFKTQEMIVELLTKQNELAKLTQAKTSSGIQVVQKAEVPDKKVKPKRATIVLSLTFLTFFGVIVWICGQHYLKVMPRAEREQLDRFLKLLRS